MRYYSNLLIFFKICLLVPLSYAQCPKASDIIEQQEDTFIAPGGWSEPILSPNLKIFLDGYALSRVIIRRGTPKSFFHVSIIPGKATCYYRTIAGYEISLEKKGVFVVELQHTNWRRTKLSEDGYWGCLACDSNVNCCSFTENDNNPDATENKQ